MSYTTKIEGGLLELAFTGPISAADVTAATSETIALHKSEGVNRFLIDVGPWPLQASVAEIYQLPAHTYPRENIDPRTRIAILMPLHESARQGALFYENACRNRGWNARVFPDRESARQWLGEST